MSKVALCLVPSYSDSPWLNTKLYHITKACINILNLEKYPVYYFDSYNQANSIIHEYDFLVFFTAGDIVIDRDALWNKISNLNNDVGLMAHLLQEQEENTPHIHEQFFILNTKAISQIDLKFEKYKSVGKTLLRSVEDFHGGHAPKSVSLGNNKIERTMQFGSNLIEQVLDNGYTVNNFDKSWRYPDSKGYIEIKEQLPIRGYTYPNKNTQAFEHALKNLKLTPDLDHAQQLFMEVIKSVTTYNFVNAYHYDNPQITKEKFDHVIVPATGFLGEMIAKNVRAKKITFYDINKNNINFKKEVYNKWNGLDYKSFVYNWAENNAVRIEPCLEKDVQTAENYFTETENQILSKWNSWKESVDINFLHTDIISDDAILQQITNNSLIYTSTILSIFPISFITHDIHVIENRRKTLNEQTLLKNSIWKEP